MIGVAGSLLLAVATGCLLAGVRPCRHALLRGSLGAGLGLGVASLVYFVARVTGLPDLALQTVALLAAAAVHRNRPCSLCRDAVPAPSTAFERLLAIGLAAATLGAATAFLLESAGVPHGGWDAWAVWNLRARFLARAGAEWRDAFSPILNFSHPDYPLLVPGFVAHTWTLAGSETTWAPALAALVFTFAAIGLLAGGVAFLRGRESGWLAGLFLVATPYFILQGAAQYADVPLAFFVLAALLLLALDDRSPGAREFPLLAGMAAGLAAWTKNEGLLFAAVIAAARVIARVRTRQLGGLRRDALILAPLVPILALVFWQRHLAAAPPPVLSGAGAHAFDLSRYWTVAAGLATALWTFGDLWVSPFLFLAAYIWLAQPDRGANRVTAWTLLAALGLMFAGYAMVYVVSAGDVAWLLDTSAHRVIMQIWPACLLAAWLFTAKPRVRTQGQ